MAEKRRPGFNIPLNFYDGPEVESIPKRIRAAAVGVWALAGNYAATGLTDGYVGLGILKTFGCTDAIRAALKVTINKKGELSPLWVDARNGGVQLTNWPKHQRTNDEVVTYRAAEAERKRIERAAKELRKVRDSTDGNTAYLTRTNDEVTAQQSNRSGERSSGRNGPTSDNAEMSGRTNAGQRADVRPDAGDPKTETETETKTENFGYVPESASLSTARDAQAATPGADLVRELIPSTIPDSERTMLRIKASSLLREGSAREDVSEGLRLYLAKPHLGAGALPALVSEAIRSRSAPPNGKTHKLRTLAELEQETRAQENAQLETFRATRELT